MMSGHAFAEQKAADNAAKTEHKALEAMAGQWTYEAKFWMAAGTEPETSVGSNNSALIYGGRFLKEESRGTWNGEPFEGTGYTGFDNVKGEYTSVWIDSAATGMMHSSGQYDEAKRTFTFNGSGSCPMTGEKDMKMRMEIVLADSDHYTMSAYRNAPDGSEFKGMEIAYTREA